MQKRKANQKKKTVGKDYAGPKMEVLELMYGALIAVHENRTFSRSRVANAIEAYKGWLFSK